jgi:outer membrane protein assembly factor BamD (BamD/ComL family)
MTSIKNTKEIFTLKLTYNVYIILRLVGALMAEERQRPLKVFLCHASGDKPTVRVLYQRLVRDGVDAWLDKEKLLPGQDWQVEIPKAVRESDVVVVCLSNKSITKEGYIQKELKFALDIANEKPEGTIFLIPARLEECEVPARLGSWQWVDLFEPDGYERLMRSLRLRADKLGMRGGETSYTDRELEQRLDQLYTEGLAALWVEDWDKACHRFQTILREKPDHLQAATKLEEAKRQKYLNDLYVQALDAQQNENWQAVVVILEKLTGEASDYKDAPLILKNARKKNHLAQLYTEAHRLYKAKQWQAVIKVFAQIAAIEPNYQDPDNLLPSAEKELAGLKRLAELNELYSRGVREMDAGSWQEARRLLEQVHKSQTGFLETERLLRKSENEITKIEARNQRKLHVNTLYEQAHELIRSKNWRKALDKIEEIQSLDDQFVDRDGISEKARAELDREEEIVRRQNELAAMYTEAVRLLKEEKYQEALDKWQEVRAMDPRYPDRQSVQRTVNKRLLARGSRVGNLRQIGILSLLGIGLALIAWLAFRNRETPGAPIVVTVSTQTPMPSPSPTPFTKYNWSFDTNTQGWGTHPDDHNISSPTVADGLLAFTVTGDDPYIHSPSKLSIIASDTPVITMRMRIVDGRLDEGAIYFITNKDGNYSESKVKIFPVSRDNGSLQTINIDMSKVATWQDIVTGFRLDPVNDEKLALSDVQVLIDYISVHAP